MKRGFLSLLTFLGAALFIAPLPASAHRMPVTVTTVEDLSDGTVGITHRFHLHDAIEILARQGGETPNMDLLENQGRVALYVAGHFEIAIADADGKPVKAEVELLGAEVEGDYVFVYQQFTPPAKDTAVWFRSSLLKEIGNDWLSHINVETGPEGTPIRSITFTGREKWREVDL